MEPVTRAMEKALRSALTIGALALAAASMAQPPCGGLIRPAFTYIQANQEVYFIDSSITHNISVVRSWDMGYLGGTIGDSTEFFHYFPDTLPHNVCLTLTDTAAGQFCQTTYCRQVRSDIDGYCTGVVDPSFVVSDGTVNGAEFTSTSTILTPAESYWELGDGTTDTSAYASHTYLWPGKHYVALNHVAYDQQSQSYCRSSAERWVAVDGNGATCNQQLFANFSSSGNGSGFWTFNAETVTALAQVGLEVWSFGDGSISIGPIALHQYIDGLSSHQVCMLTAAVDGLQDTCYAYVCHTVSEALVGLEEVRPDEGLVVWPTPFTDGLTISLGPTARSTRIQLVDALGRVVQQTQATTDLFQWSLPTVPSGVYVLRVEQNGAVRSIVTVREGH
ncbi:MAG: T9SS type A sorting domain-containing protein [Flavobacteriales bacterium]|nr:T9SS type A sorting domain-containing protein [Flavobacteriales bacterium]